MSSFHLMVGTPCYGGMLTTEYAKSLLNLQNALHSNGHKMTTLFLGNESLIQRGRNTIAHAFLNDTDASHLLFCDADIRFDPNDVAKMIKADKELIVAPVPMKGINWDRVTAGVLNGNKNPKELTGYFALTELEGHAMLSSDQPFEIRYGGTGLMLIKRTVFQRMMPVVGSYISKGDVTSDEIVYDFFQVKRHDNILLSEDYFFCHQHRELGGKVWAAPWFKVAHFGAYPFEGSYAECAQQDACLDINVVPNGGLC